LEDILMNLKRVQLHGEGGLKMSACVKCWSDAHLGAQFSVVDNYEHLIIVRACTPEEQAGPDAAMCECGRKTRHELTGECMACGS